MILYTVNFARSDSRDIKYRNNVDDVLNVPDDVWETERNWTLTHPNEKITVRQVGNDLDPPAEMTMSIKVIYNKAWVQSAGNGNVGLAATRAQVVVNQAQQIYSTKFAEGNRLGTIVRFSLVGGGK